jgi:LemA protein
MILGLLVVALILFGVPLWIVGVYNRLVSLRNLNESAWAQTDVQLRRRYDLIPNLVETVKGYATHERETFEKVTQARNAAMSATEPQTKAGPENALTSVIKSVFAVAEAYPELKANQNFIALQEELTTTEGFIAECRSHYNDSVATYNTTRQVFPANIVAGVFKFEPREYFGVPDQAERGPVKVQL